MFELAGEDCAGLLADVTHLLTTNGCNVRSAAVRLLLDCILNPFLWQLLWLQGVCCRSAAHLANFSSECELLAVQLLAVQLLGSAAARIAPATRAVPCL